MTTKYSRALRVLFALYAKRAPSPVLRRAERLVHRLGNAKFLEGA